MILTSTPFILSVPASHPLTHPRILWENRIENLLASAITVSSESDTGPRDAPTTWNTDTYWEPLALPAWIIFDFGQSYNVNAVSLAGHNFGSKLTTVKVEVGLDPSFSDGIAFGAENTPPDDSTMLLLDTDRPARYMRIGLTGSAIPRLSVAMAGAALVMEKAVSGPYRPIGMSRTTILNARKSRGGQFLGQGFRAHGLATDVSFRHLSERWVLENFNAFSKHARSKPYTFASNPQDFPRDVGYVWTPEDITPVYNGTGVNMDVDWPMVGLGHE